jgi:hypothetical protein
MKKFALVLALTLVSASLFAEKTNKDLSINSSCYIVSEHEVRLFDNGKMHRNIFKWICEMHHDLGKFVNQYDNIKSFEVFVKNDCSKKCQLVMLTFKDGKKKKIQVDNYIVYIQPDPDSVLGFSVKSGGLFAPPELLAKLPLIFTDEVMVASQSW